MRLQRGVTMARYFINMNSYLESPAILLQNMVIFLAQNKQEEGEILFNDFAGVKIVFNMRTGYVDTQSLEEKKGITNYYSLEIFSHVITLLMDAISLLSKIDLLRKLHQLGDRRICDIIKRNGIFDQATGQICEHNVLIVDKTLYEIKTL